MKADVATADVATAAVFVGNRFVARKFDARLSWSDLSARHRPDWQPVHQQGHREQGYLRAFRGRSIFCSNGGVDIDFTTKKGDAFVRAVETIPAAQ